MLRIAIQTKGRLNEKTTELLNELGMKVDDAKRKFLQKVEGFPLEVLYLRDDDIPGVVESGVSSLGIVGYNEVAEKGADVDIVRKLGFGGCRISLAIPKAEAEQYCGPKYFEGKKIATSYPVILKKYLAEHGVSAQIEVITGSVEIAPAAGIADAIFDIVSSGSTLVSNGLLEVEKVFESEAVLIANKNIAEEDRAYLDELLFRIGAREQSLGMKYLLMNIPNASLEEAIRILPAMKSPTVMPLAIDGWSSMHSVVKESELWDKVRALKAIGAEGILVLNLDKIIQ